MRAIKIDSENQVIIEIDIDDNYKAMQQVVGGSICIGHYYPDDKHTCYIDDEGLLKNPRCFFASKFGNQPLAGNGLIVGFDPTTGESTPCTLTIEEVNQDTIFLDLEQVQELIQAGVVDYSIYFTSDEGTKLIDTIDLGAFDEKKST